MRKVITNVVMLFLFVVLIVGCSTSEKAGSSQVGSSNEPPAQTDNKNTATEKKDLTPVTISIALSNAMLNEEEFEQYVATPVKDKYPHITAERINMSQEGQSLNELIAAGVIPDIVGSWIGPLSNIPRLGLAMDIEPLITKHNFEVARLEPGVLEDVRLAANVDYIMGFPIYTNAFALFYNKDIFDRFGVEYPVDGMTWEEIKSLAEQLTRTDEGVQYRGIFPGGIGRVAHHMSLPYADFEKGIGLMDTEPWKHAYELWRDLVLIEGNYKNMSGGGNDTDFINGELAMVVTHSSTMMRMREQTELNWDMVSYPQDPSQPGVGYRLDPLVLNISEQTEHPDEAFLVMDTILSDEVQTAMMHNGRLSVLKDESIKQEFGKGLTGLEGKNVAAMTKYKFARHSPLRYLPDGDVNTVMTEAFDKIIQGIDVNTALREGNEQMNQLISEYSK